MVDSLLVTGGAGFIGSNFVKFVNEKSPETRVRILDDFSAGLESNLSGLDVEIFSGSVLDDSCLDKALANTSAVVHLAGLGGVPRSLVNPVETHLVNVTGTIKLLEACRRQDLSQIIFASSSSVYGDNPKLPRSEDDWTAPLSPYAASKMAAESYVLSYGRSYGIKTLVYRFFNVYGPKQRAHHQYAAVIPKFIASALAGQPLGVEGDGLQTRDFTHVSSVVKVLWDSVERKISDSRPVNLAFGQRTTVLQLVEVLGEVLGSNQEVVFTDNRPGNVQESQADNTKLLALFPGLSQVPLVDGIRDTVQWHQSR